jgi:hypothetical protein
MALLRCASLSDVPLTLGEIGVVRCCCSVFGPDYDEGLLSVEKARIHCAEKAKLKTMVFEPIRFVEKAMLNKIDDEPIRFVEKAMLNKIDDAQMRCLEKVML